MVLLLRATRFNHSIKIHYESQKSPIGWDYHELKKGHDVMITAPKELVQLVEALLDE